MKYKEAVEILKEEQMRHRRNNRLCRMIGDAARLLYEESYTTTRDALESALLLPENKTRINNYRLTEGLASIRLVNALIDSRCLFAEKYLLHDVQFHVISLAEEITAAS